jgi:hypothetical protein
MRRVLLALLALAASTPAHAIPAAPRPIHSYYGPIRICTPLFAFDVQAGEGYWDTGREHIVRFGRHHFTFGERWSLDGPQHRDFVRPMGTLDVPGIGTLERVELTARNDGGPRIVYLYDTRERQLYPKVQIASDLFDGSDRDVARLERLAFGQTRVDMCAEIPDRLRPRPDREDSDAFWIRQDRPAGPLTMCWSRLALDVRRGEAVIPFWLDLGEFGVATRRFRVTISGNFAAPFEPGWRRVEGALAAHSEFQVRADNAQPGIPSALRAPDGREPRRVRLVRLLEDPDHHPHGGVGFAFSGPASEAEMAAFVRRLRLRTPRDTCFEETP